MNLREAQLLGVLGVIAIGIILFCMWGGSDDLPDQTVASSDVGGLSTEPSIADICGQLRRESTEPPPVFEPVQEETTIEIGDGPPAGVPELDEHAGIWDMLQEMMPPEIGITPQTDSPTAPAPSPPPSRPRPVLHVVQKGETLSSISRKYYGTEGKWRLIHEANKSVIPNPDALPLGAKLKIPPKSGTATTEVASAGSARPVLTTRAESAAPAQRTYTAKGGDTLYRIALKYYGDGSKWKDILRANSDKIQQDRDLKAGMVVVIP